MDELFFTLIIYFTGAMNSDQVGFYETLATCEAAVTAVYEQAEEGDVIAICVPVEASY